MEPEGRHDPAPHTPQNLKLSLTSTNWEFLFGDYGTSISGGKMVKLTIPEATGIQWNYKKGPWGFKTALVESKTSPGEEIMTGDGTSGPYQLATMKQKAVILSSVRVEKEGVTLPSDKYDIDVVNGEIKFKDNVLVGQTVVISYEQSAFNFTTGDLIGTRIDYRPENKRFKAGAAYIQAKSNIEGTTLTFNEVEDFPMPASEDFLPLCKVGLDATSSHCVEVQLGNMYIVPGSIVISQQENTGRGAITEINDLNDELYIPHRGYLKGKIYLDYAKLEGSETNKYGDFKVSYDYYNPAFIEPTGLIVYTGVNNFTTTSGQPWPSQIFPGSELLYESDDSEQKLDSDDSVQYCFRDESEVSIENYEYDSDGDGLEEELDYEIWDFPEVCDIGTAYIDSDLKQYKLMQEGINYYLDFKDSTNIDESYVKMTYDSIPTFLPSSSEFDKVAIGVNAEYKFGRKWNFTTDWGRTNSDLSSTFHTYEDRITIDAVTMASDEDFGERCRYEFSQLDEGILTCKLAHGNVFGNVTVQIEKCVRTTDINNECIPEDGHYPIEALDKLFNVTPDGEIRIKGQNKANSYECVIDGETELCYKAYSQFPDDGDILVVNYVFEPKLARLVEAEGYDFTAKFNTKAFKKSFGISLHKHEHDPNYDQRLGGGGGFTSLIEVSNNFSIKKLGVGIEFANRRKDETGTAGEKTDELSRSLNSPTRSIKLNYAPTGRMDQITFGRTVQRDYGMTNIQNDQREDKTSRNLNFGTGYSLNKNGTMKLLLIHAQADSSDKITPTNSTRQKTDTYSWNYARSKKTVLTAVRSISSSSKPTTQKSTTSDYKLKLKPFAVTQGLDIGFKRARTSSEQTTGTQTNVNDTIRYSLIFVPLWKISNLAYTFNRSDRAPSQSQQVGDRTDNTTIKFNFKLGQRFTWVPNISRNSQTSEARQSRTETTGWNASYTGRMGKAFNYALTADKNNIGRSDNDMKTITTSSTTATSRGMTLNYRSSERTRHNFVYKNSRRQASSIRNYDYSLVYTPYTRLSITSRFNHSSSSGLNTRKYDFIMSYRISDQTKLKLNYQNKTDKRVLSNKQRKTLFQVELKTDFKGNR